MGCITASLRSMNTPLPSYHDAGGPKSHFGATRIRHAFYRKRFIFLGLIIGAFIVFVVQFKPDGIRRIQNFRLSSDPDAVRATASEISLLPLPKYEDVRELEENLPQHNLSLPFPEGQNGRYVRFSNQIQGLGWNNVLNDVLLCSHLSWRAKRAYVFQDYEWNMGHYPWQIDELPQARTPMNALIAGPTAGGSWGSVPDNPRGYNTPRSISSAWFDVVCPKEKRKIIEAAEAKNPTRGQDAQKVMDYWAKLLLEMEDGCVEVVPGEGDSFPQTFDLWTVSKPLIIPLWEEFRDSPVSRLLRTPPLVSEAIKANEHLFYPGKTPGTYPSSSRYDALLAVHLRRGDYDNACTHLANWNSTFYMWNLLPQLPDRLKSGPPVGAGIMGTNTPENNLMYRRRCWPTDEEFITKVHEVRRDWEDDGVSNGKKLRTLYIMTNGKKEWMYELKKKLVLEGWDNVVTSGDLKFNSDQMGVSNVVDMDIARMAAVFIGNGWSSMGSNIVHRRLVDGHPYSSNRFL